MTADRYVRAVLTVIAAALVYLCVVLTPLPGVHAQAPRPGYSAPTPGEQTGPASVVIVGWQLPEGQSLPVHVPGAVRVTGQVGITGEVQTKQVTGGFDRVVLSGWEPQGPMATGTYRRWNEPGGLPVVEVQPR